MSAAAAGGRPRYGAAGRNVVRLDDPRALACWRELLAVAHTRRDRLVRQLLRGPGTALAARLLSGSVPAATTRWEPVYERAAALLGDALRGLEPGIVVRDYAGTGRGRMLFFLFAPEGRAPRAVLKARPVFGTGMALRAEWEMLRALAARLPAELARTVPAPMGFATDDDTEALLASHVPGRSGYVELFGSLAPARHVARQLAGAVDWLTRFQAATRLADRTLDPALLEVRWRVLHARLLPHDRGDVSRESRGFEALAAAPTLALVARHGDYWVRNVLYTREGEVTVVDWEQGVLEASPLDDLFQFMRTYGAAFPWTRRGAPPVEAFALTFLRESVVSRHVGAELRRWRERAGIPAAAIRSLFLLHLLRKADVAGTLPARGGGTLTRPQWLECYRMLATADRSVFSG